MTEDDTNNGNGFYVRRERPEPQNVAWFLSKEDAARTLCRELIEPDRSFFFYQRAEMLEYELSFGGKILW